MTTAQKKRRKKSRAGRPPKEGVVRTASGRISRATAQADRNANEIRQTAVQTRIRQAAAHGEVIDEQEAISPHRGSVAGQKYLQGDFGCEEIGAIRLQRGNDIAATILKCKSILGYPPPTAQAMDIGRVKGLSLEGLNLAERVKIAVSTLMRIEGSLGSAGTGCRTRFFEVFIHDDAAALDWSAAKNAQLVKALDALR